MHILSPLKAAKRDLGKRFNYHLNIETGSKRIIIPVFAGIGRAHLDKHESHIFVLLQRLYKPGTMLVDVGVNIGQTLIKYFAVAGQSIRYRGFEPNPICCFYTDELISANKIPNADIVPIGLGDEQGLVELLVASDGPDPGASIIKGYRDPGFYSNRKFISVLPGDQVFPTVGINEGGFILKIDVEGAELEVVKGLKRTLLNLRPTVIMEILPPAEFSDNVNALRITRKRETIAFMTECGYTCSNISPDGTLNGETATTDYLFLPESTK